MKKLFAFLVVLVMAVAAAAPIFAQGAPTELSAWRHIGDVQEEMDYFGSLVDGFNASQNEWKVVWEELPQGSYEDSINAAALAGNLPCLMDVDGPFVPNFAWAGYVVPLDSYISDALRADLLPAALGEYNGQTYGVGLFDAVIGVWGRRSIMEKYDLRIATVDEPWTKDEFDAMLETLAASDEFDVAIEMYNFYTHEWWPYAYSTLLQSFGGDLINRETYLSAEGVLNGPEAVAWGEWFQNIFQSGLADPNPPDDQGFIQGRAGLAFIGNWQYPNMYAAWGDDLIVMPPPDLGHGPVVGGGSWQWAISSACEHPDGAWAFIEYVSSPEATAGYSDVTGLVPARISAAPLTVNYSEAGPLAVMVQFANKWVIIRPPTPAYAVISDEFFKAAQAISFGADVQNTLDDAVDKIDQDITDNNGYGFGQ